MQLDRYMMLTDLLVGVEVEKLLEALSLHHWERAPLLQHSEIPNRSSASRNQRVILRVLEIDNILERHLRRVLRSHRDGV